MRIDMLFTGFPGKTDRGFLGWSSCVLLRPPRGRPMLFDTAGFNERAVLLEKLGRLGVDPDEVGAVFLSHFHFDHAANFGLFRRAVCYVHELEAEHIRGGGGRDPALIGELFEPLRQSGRLVLLRGGGGTVQGVRWAHTPGHTPGLYSLFAERGGERWALASDAVKHRHELLSGAADAADDPRRSAASIRLIRESADIVVPGHDAPLRVRVRGDTVDVRPLAGNRVVVFGLAADGRLSRAAVLGEAADAEEPGETGPAGG